jgi:hypothetical protein
MSRRAATWLAWSECAAALVFFALTLLLIFLGWSTPLPMGWVPWQGQIVSTAGFVGAPVLGGLIASRRPENPYGWLWLSLGLRRSSKKFGGRKKAGSEPLRPFFLPLLKWRPGSDFASVVADFLSRRHPHGSSSNKQGTDHEDQRFGEIPGERYSNASCIAPEYDPPECRHGQHARRHAGQLRCPPVPHEISRGTSTMHQHGHHSQDQAFEHPQTEPRYRAEDRAAYHQSDPVGGKSPPTRKPYVVPSTVSRTNTLRAMRQKSNQKAAIRPIPLLSIEPSRTSPKLYVGTGGGVEGVLGSVALRHQLEALGVHP